MLRDMTIQRMDNVAIVVDDLDAAVAFFTELGMELEGKGPVEGLWADRTSDSTAASTGSSNGAASPPDTTNSPAATKQPSPSSAPSSGLTNDPPDRSWALGGCK